MTWQHPSGFTRAEPQRGDFIQILGPDGEPSLTNTRVKTVVSEDRSEELWEVIDSFNQTRIITNLRPKEWLEVWLAEY